MKKTTKILLFATLVFGLAFLAGCGGLGRKVSISKLKEDIINSPRVQSCFTSPFIKESIYTINELEIIKEQENEDVITTYSDVVIENESLSISLIIKTIYNYYDRGGWIMDELYIEEIEQVIPLTGPDTELVNNYLSEFYTLVGIYNETSTNIIPENVEFNITDSVLNDSTNAYVYATYQNPALSANGYFSFTFTSDGWVNDDTTDDRPNYNIIELNADYSKALGVFEKKNGAVVYSAEINILSIRDTTIEFKVTNFVMPSFYFDVMEDCTQISEFNPLTGSCNIGFYYSAFGPTPLTMTYNPENDTWGLMFESLSRKQ